jgi:C-terminal processing protease CtpA/Prc
LVNERTTDDELWNIDSAMLLNLNDGHVQLSNSDYTRYFEASRIIFRSHKEFSIDLIKSRYIPNTITIGDGLITYGISSDQKVGYIYIARFVSDYGNGIDWAYQIDDALQALSGVESMIIDIRNNGGGVQNTLRYIASAFIDREISYLYTREKTGPGHADLGPLMPLDVEPRTNAITFRKKIVLLTNRFSASASEHFTEIFRNLSYSTQIGDTTYGAFGDIIKNAELPNGWSFYYPVRLTTTPDGKCLEGIGIAPQIYVKNTEALIVSGRDLILEYALQYLGE